MTRNPIYKNRLNRNLSPRPCSKIIREVCIHHTNVVPRTDEVNVDGHRDDDALAVLVTDSELHT
jgi:hypothetical protein